MYLLVPVQGRQVQRGLGVGHRGLSPSSAVTPLRYRYLHEPPLGVTLPGERRRAKESWPPGSEEAGGSRRADTDIGDPLRLLLGGDGRKSVLPPRRRKDPAVTSHHKSSDRLDELRLGSFRLSLREGSICWAKFVV